MLKDYGKTNFITGLRALSATMVVAIHTGAFRDFGWIGDNITDAGIGGVYIFFVVAGFSITQSFARDGDFVSYFQQRFVRIAPLYYLMLVASALLLYFGLVDVSLTKLKNGADYGVMNFVYNILFFGYLDRTVPYAILGVDWTLAIEMTWYVILPALIARTPGWTKLAAWMAMTVALALVARKGFSFFLLEKANLSLHFFPTQYGFYFVAGAIAHKIRFQSDFPTHKAANIVLCSGLLIFLANCLFSVGNSPKMFAIAAFLVIISYHQQSRVLCRLLENGKVLLLGNISYGLYLFHMPIILVMRSQGMPASGLVGFVLVYALSVLFAYYATAYFEMPICRWHRQIINPA